MSANTFGPPIVFSHIKALFLHHQTIISSGLGQEISINLWLRAIDHHFLPHPPSTHPLTSLHVPFLEGGGQHLVAPVLLGEVLQGAGVRLHLLVQPAAVDEHGRTAALGVPAPLAKHLLQLLDRVAALPLANAVLLDAAVAAPQRLQKQEEEEEARR